MKLCFVKISGKFNAAYCGMLKQVAQNMKFDSRTNFEYFTITYSQCRLTILSDCNFHAQTAGHAVKLALGKYQMRIPLLLELINGLGRDLSLRRHVR